MIQSIIFHLAAATCPHPGEVLVNGTCNQTNLPIVDAGHYQLDHILQLLFGILAALAVLFVVIGGLRFVLSEGDPQGTAKARSTMIYAVVGLVVAILAEVIVTFVLGRL